MRNRKVKRRYNAAKIARAPALKKKLAYFIAKHDLKNSQYDLTTILATGHRGYISYDEKELCSLFDDIYSRLVEKEKDIQEEIESLIKRGSRLSYEIEYLEGKLKHHRDTCLAEAKELANEIFEKEILGL